jgi:hypothetical protein
MNVFEKMGIIEDHLREWGDRTIKALKQCVKKDDIILATTGGELECLRIAFKLKNVIGCPAFVFYHDPIDYVKYDGMVLDNKFHICRDKYENKYLEKMDGIFVSSEKFKKCLTQKYPGLKNKIYYSIKNFT